MPKKLEVTEGDPNELVPYQFMAPRWFKNDCIITAQYRGKTLADWSRDKLQVGLDEDRPTEENGSAGRKAAAEARASGRKTATASRRRRT
jgi:hypothetical protein